MVYISDIDGTLLRKGVVPIPQAVEKVNALAKEGQTVILVTGRSEDKRSDTQVALRNAGIQYSELLMNTFGSSKQQQIDSKAYNVKRIMMTTPVDEVTDNDGQMRRAYEALGLTTKASW